MHDRGADLAAKPVAVQVAKVVTDTVFDVKRKKAFFDVFFLLNFGCFLGY